MLRIALKLWYGPGHTDNPALALRRATTLLGSLVFITILSGGLVAGLKAGHAYNTFPLMDGRWIPQAIFMQEPLWRNFFENIATVQFNHRVLATLTFLGVISTWLISFNSLLTKPARIGMHLLMLTAVLQVALGISTLLLNVPTTLAAMHQAGAMMLLTATLFLHHHLTDHDK